MASDDIKSDRLYTKDHEWVQTVNGNIVVGLSAFSVDQLGDITLVNIDVRSGDTTTAGKAFGTIESVKTLADLFAPVSGKIVQINYALESKPELVNDDCYGQAWLIEIAPSDLQELQGLMDASQYADYLKTAAH